MSSLVHAGPGAGAAPTAKPKPEGTPLWKFMAPIGVAILLALIPPPAGLPQYAWYFFAIFAGVIVGLMLEPLPGAAIGLIGVSTVTVLSPWVFFSAEQLSKPGFKPANASLTWACLLYTSRCV